MKIFKFGGSIIKSSYDIISAIKIILKEFDLSLSDLTTINNSHEKIEYEYIPDLKHRLESKQNKFGDNNSTSLLINKYITKNNKSLFDKFENKKVFIVISAFDKTTSMLEELYFNSLQNKDYSLLLNKLYQLHKDCLNKLNEQFYTECIHKLNKTFNELKVILKNNYVHDQKLLDKVLSNGEFLSSIFFYYYLYQFGLNSKWINITNFIKTDNHFGNAEVNFSITKERFKEFIDSNNKIIITQGFLGSTIDDEISTLGKEGSDYSASIIASMLNASSVTLWKDVEGIMDCDPKEHSKTIKIDEISYKEMAEMSFYGAKVIHHKTFQPLLEKNIPLFIKSFNEPQSKGTKIHLDAPQLSIPVYIYKKNQCLLTFYIKNSTFITDNQISQISNFLRNLNIKINITEQSASSFSICFNQNIEILKSIEEEFSSQLLIKFNNNLTLLTIRNFENDHKLIDYKNIYLKKRNRKILQIVFEKLSLF
ncbi:MAG: aspartate kinase [Bacteroidetes bacterium]|nr:aspartate kinase [Bacteroidota bacterium]